MRIFCVTVIRSVLYLLQVEIKVIVVLIHYVMSNNQYGPINKHTLISLVSKCSLTFICKKYFKCQSSKHDSM